MAAPVIQPSLAAGELSPSLFGRIDLAKWHTGVATARNVFVNYRGGLSSRAGTAYVGICKQPGTAAPPRDIRFQFNVTQSYALEFGDYYMRVKINGAYVVETALNITAATQANPGKLTVPGNTFANDDWIYIQDVGGMTQLNGNTYRIANVNPVLETFTLVDLFGNPLNTLNYSAYTSGGTVSRLYTLTTPYAAVDLPYLKFTQSADVMSLCCRNQQTGTEYPPYDLARLAADNWELTLTTFETSITAPSTCTVAASATTSSNQTQYKFVVTSVDALTGEESVASPVGTVSNSVNIAVTSGTLTVTWASVAGAGSYNIYKAPAAYNTSVPIGSLFGYAGTAFGVSFADTNITQDFTKIPPQHLNPFARGSILGAEAATQGAAYVQATTSVTINTTTGSGAVITPVVSGGAVVAYIVDNEGENYADTDTMTVVGAGAGATGTLTIGPQTGTYPSVPSYFQQRRVYAGSQNEPDTYHMSQPGAYSNFDSAEIPTDADAITGTPWAQQINGIQAMVPRPGGLIILTGLDAWQLSGTGGAATPVTPSSQSAQQQASNGCNPIVPPLTIVSDILYVQTKGSNVRNLVYNFQTNIYTGNDLTILSNHLFQFRQITQWCWAEEPYKVVWALRDDGILLSLTLLRDQEIYGWARHDTNGIVVGVCSLSEPPIDAVYLIVKRYVQGQWIYFSERMNDRLWETPEDCWCVDCGSALVQPTPNATITASASRGTGVQFQTNAPVFGNAAVGDVIRMGGGAATITSITTTSLVIGDITTNITDVLLDDPDDMPVPQVSGDWTLTTPVTTVTGLAHLEGKVVAILADGSVVPNQIVVDGEITLPRPATQVTAGLPFVVQVQSLYGDIPGEAPTVQGRRKNIYAVTARVEHSRGFSIGTNQPDASVQPNQSTVAWANMKEWKQRGADTAAGAALPLFTGDARVNVPGTWAKPGQVAVQQNFCLPLNLLSLIPEVIIGDTPDA